MTDPLSNLESMAAAFFANEQNPTAERIREVVDDLRMMSMFQSVSEEDAELLARRFEQRVGITQSIGSVSDRARPSTMVACGQRAKWIRTTGIATGST